MMLWKNRNKKVGLCVLIVTSCFILAALWPVMATPETAQAKSRPASGVNYKMVIDTEDPAPGPATLLTDNGDGSPWTFFTRTTVTPTGSD